jgi:hypothetical protein
LSDILCSCRAAGPCVHRVAAVLAFQAAKGRRKLESDPPALAPSDGAPRTREQVLASIGIVLREMVLLGLSRLSAATEARLRTLTVSAHGVDLPRLERVLYTLADEVSRALRRDAQASSASLLSAASQLEALRCALARPSADLVGVHRSRYEKAGDIDLVGMGARQWQGQSGYVGLTVYFWDRSCSNWATWTESRPLSVGAFDPELRYHFDGPWTDCDSPFQASRHVLRLLSAWRNPAGRLSGRRSTRCVLVRDTTERELPPPTTTWAELAARACRFFGGGLQGRSEQDEVVFLRPERWDRARFDDVRQELVQPVYDSAGHSLLLILPHTPQSENAIRLLERHDPANTRGLVGLLRLEAERLAVEPVAIHGEKLVNLTLDDNPTNKKKAAAHRRRKRDESIEDSEPEAWPEPEIAASASSVGILLGRAAAQLEAIAEGGVHSARDVDRLLAVSKQSDAVGLSSVARPVARLAAEIDEIPKSSDGDASSVAATLLHAYYVVKSAIVQEVVAGVASSIGG